MKRFITLFLLLSIALTVIGCTKNESKSLTEHVFDVEEVLKAAVAEDVTADIEDDYGYGSDNVEVNVASMKAIGNSLYTVRGKVIVTDDFGDEYEAKFEGKYKLEGEHFGKTELHVYTPKRSN